MEPIWSQTWWQFSHLLTLYVKKSMIAVNGVICSSLFFPFLFYGFYGSIGIMTFFKVKVDALLSLLRLIYVDVALCLFYSFSQFYGPWSLKFLLGPIPYPSWMENSFADLWADLLNPRLLVFCGDRYSTSCPSKSQSKMLVLVLSTDN